MNNSFAAKISIIRGNFQNSDFTRPSKAIKHLPTLKPLFCTIRAFNWEMSGNGSSISLLFDHQVRNNYCYVLNPKKVDEIVREWELITNSSFTNWSVDKNFGSIGKYYVLRFNFQCSGHHSFDFHDILSNIFSFRLYCALS